MEGVVPCNGDDLCDPRFVQSLCRVQVRKLRRRYLIIAPRGDVLSMCLLRHTSGVSHLKVEESRNSRAGVTGGAFALFRRRKTVVADNSTLGSDGQFGNAPSFTDPDSD